MKSTAMKRIVWSIDAFENPDHHRNALFLLGSLSRATQAEILPVHVLGHPFADPKGASDFEEAYKALAEKRMSELSKTSDIATMEAGRVLINRESSIRSSVERLLEHARTVSADAIVVATHSRTGLQRMLMGSFAETLLLKSEIPVITVNPQSRIREKVQNILFPTTFDPRFRPGFEKAAALTRALDAKLTLIYKEPYVPLAYTSPLVQQHLERETAERKSRAKEWAIWAAQFGAPVITHYDERPGNVACAIEEFAEVNDIDMVAMVSEAEPLTGTLTGSTCRQVVRSALCPVWVIHSDVEVRDSK